MTIYYYCFIPPKVTKSRVSLVLPQNKTHEQQERMIGNILSEMKEIGLIHPEGRTWFLKS